MAIQKNRLIANERGKRAENADRNLLRRQEIQQKENIAYQNRIDKHRENEERSRQVAQVSSDKREVAIRQDEERMNREVFKAEQDRLNRQNELMVRLEQAKLEAKIKLEVTHLNHSHSMVGKTKDFLNEVALRNGQYSYELKQLNMDHSEKRKTEILVSKTRHQQVLEIQKNEQEQALSLNSYKHEHEKNLASLKEKYLHAEEAEKRDTYAHNAYVDIQVHSEKEIRNTKEYEKRAKTDMETAASESLNYAYRAMVDAKLKVWVMEQELRIFGRKASDAEIDNYVRDNHTKWERELG
jgi:hypothetical protein